MQALLNAIAQMANTGDAHRVFHGRGGLYPGCEHWTLDWFSPVWVLTSFKIVSEYELALCHQALAQRWDTLAPSEPLNWVFQCRAQGEAQTRLMAGSVPEPHVVTEQGAKYLVHVMRGQNHGLFLDMAKGREWLKRHAKHENILNLFAYTCAFSVVALQGGAAQVLNLDMSHGALAVGQQNHRLNDLPAKARFLGHDIFKTWGKINKMGPYGVIVIDPPSYQKGSFIATKDYIKLIRRLPDLLEPQGHVLLCLNAPELDTQFLHEQVAEAAPCLHFVERLANPAAFVDIDPEKSLKVLHYQNA
ncbi:class I SAM-dependent methyltransferase [Limnohabitans sp.]|uniref:class I SAM-dependent methyltransferase n=1 Tax=Limnohabitans sp. TaxID=1907725 RepID=UPI0033418187